MKVISFSLWGKDERFMQGALANTKLAREVYPDWQCWFYLDAESPYCWGMELESAGGTVFWDHWKNSPWEGLFWRFQPIFNPFITCTIVRDCDSRVNPREAAAVAAWLKSAKLFHVMRDHYEHNVPIMGGMFGSRHWPEFQGRLKAWTQRANKGDDQVFLADKVWPEVRRLTLGHDRYATGLSMPNKGGIGTYEYRPQEQLGEHQLMNFPEHAALDPHIHGEHVGARVGV